MAQVYFASARVEKWRYEDSMPAKLERMLQKIDLEKFFEKNEWVAVKTHFGSQGAHRIVRPVFLRKIVDAIKSVGAMPFVCDTVRIRGLEYLEVANYNGINHLSVNAPVILADGIFGNDNIMVKAGEILGEIAVASAIHDAPAMVVCSHVKGHIQAGYAGAIKNLAMGGVSAGHRHCGWKCGRGSMHAIGEGQLVWDASKCIFCYQCVEVCPLGCIEFAEGQMKYDSAKCWRCGRCARVCQSDALSLPVDDVQFMKSLAESAQAVLSTFKPQKVLYVNFLTEVQPECDCMPAAEVPVVQDLGILISDDLVAIEQASIDLLLKAKPLPSSLAEDMNIQAGEDIFKKLHRKQYHIQIEEAVRLGLGNKEYELLTLS
jgi:uncharacterized Fe-S center protein